MKKRLSMILGAVALMATGVASIGCPWLILSEPDAKDIFND